MRVSWSREEVEAAVADYFDMLGKELRGEEYNKAEHNRQLARLVKDRSHGAIERKHQNISAVLIEFGFPYIEGYKPLGNYQELLGEVVAKRLSAAAGLRDAVGETVQAIIDFPPKVGDLLGILVPTPVRETNQGDICDSPIRRAAIGTRNYLEIEARNQSLGRAGEDLVLEFEHERLWRAGKHDLAEKITNVSRSQGDHLGYDLLSFETSGRERLIEVKTTRFGALTPFFASRNEVNVSEQREEQYKLYRLFNFRKHPQLYILEGSIRNSCAIEPVSYSALPR